MSQHDWKPGDRAMVIVDRGVSKGMVALKSKDGASTGVWLEALRPLPTPDPITELERAVVEAATVEWRQNHSAPFISDEPIANLYAAVLALLFARTPPAPVDPMTALRDAWEAPRGLLWAEGVQAALDAAEAAWKESKA
jgi:hypothetical protein